MHTHTELCDGVGSVNDFCEAAHKKNFDSIGFSAHAPTLKKIDIDTGWHLRDIDTYSAHIRKAKEDWKGKLKVYMGLEVDYIQNYIAPIDSDIQNLGLDYIIGSVHAVLPPNKKIDWAKPFNDNKDLLCVDGSEKEFQILIEHGFNNDAGALVAAYWNAVIEMCSAGGFDILGHCDIIKKNNPDDKYFSTHDEHYLSYVSKLCDILEGTNIVVEVNTGGLNRRKTKECYPSTDILRILNRRNIPVTINADAHECSHIDGNYDAARYALVESGYTHFMLYNGRVDGRSLWAAEAL
jgi:histidinol-phosphatase (PHP family)